MADIKITSHPTPGDKSAQDASPSVINDDDITEAIELLFFAYRDFISDPDAILTEFGFGRAHHRVIHFVGRNPGIKVADLLEILRITKQSLARVLKQLIERDFIEQRTGPQDRRQRLLYLTDLGLDLERRLAAPQRARVRASLAGAGTEAAGAWRTIMRGLINEDARPSVDRLTKKGKSA